MTIRLTIPEDGAVAERWAHSHGRDRFSPDLLPYLGCVAEDEAGPAAMLWAYGTKGTPVAYLEHLVSRPGLTVREAREAGEAAVNGLQSALKTLGFTVLVAYALPACARYLLGMGWNVADERPKIAMLKIL